MGNMKGIAAFLIGFAGATTYKTLKNNAKEAAELANLDAGARARLFMSDDQNALYADWKKHGPRWENGYFVPMD